MTLRLVPSLLAAALVVAAAVPARADDGPPGLTPVADGQAPAPAPRTHWYGWQIMAIDAASVATAAASQNGVVMAGVYVSGGPLVHLVNQRPAAALGSAALRVGLPLAGMYTGAAMATCNDEDDWLCPMGEMALGGIAGMLTASVIDWTVLSTETAEPERGFTAAPSVAVSGRGDVRLGLSGRF
jgi:hypothetical protein